MAPTPEAKRPRFVPAASSRRQPSKVAFQYKKALARVQLRYGEAQPKEILHKLLDADADRDIVAGGMPGQAGGETLACYLFSIKDDGHPKLADGIEPWLLRQLPRYQQHLRTAACLQRAIEFALLRQHHMAGLGWLGMAGDGPGWLGMARDGSGWPEMARDGRDGPEWLGPAMCC